jgi:hypothetical protein
MNLQGEVKCGVTYSVNHSLPKLQVVYAKWSIVTWNSVKCENVWSLQRWQIRVKCEMGVVVQLKSAKKLLCCFFHYSLWTLLYQWRFSRSGGTMEARLLVMWNI